MEEEAEKSFTERIYEKTEQYVKTTVELYRLKAIHAVSGVFAGIVTGIFIWVFLFLFLLFLSFGAAFYLGDMLGNWCYGFLIVCGFYLVLGLIFYLCRGVLRKNINDSIVKQIFKD